MKHRQQFIILMSVMALAAMSLPAPLFGQDVGERVRVSLKNNKVIGFVTSVNPSGFVLIPLSGGGSFPLMYSDMKRLERSLGRGRHWKRGAIIGFGLGALLGFGVCSEDGGEFESVYPPLCAGVFGAGYGLMGMGIGGLFKWEKWETVPIPSMSGRLRISPMIDVVSIGGDRRAVLGARIRF